MVELVNTVQTIGIIIGCYTATRMISLVFKGTETNGIRIFSGVAVAITIGGVIGLFCC